jgi:ubiquinone/menaquinone biosynthesis C-methylase UbiE
LASNWIPKGTKRLLDAGCGNGNGTRHYVDKADETWGVDPVADRIAAARQRFPEIHFEHGWLEQLPFEDGFFDAVVLTDVLEHVQDETAALNEIHRVTKPGATVIITTPHAGMFGWLDPYNYGSFCRTRLPGMYRLLRRIGFAQSSTEVLIEHRHYALDDLVESLDKSSFASGYTVSNSFRSGCLLYPVFLNVFEALIRVLPERSVEIATTPFRWLSEIDYWIPWGPMSYNIAVRIRRS